MVSLFSFYHGKRACNVVKRLIRLFLLCFDAGRTTYKAQDVVSKRSNLVN